MSEPPQKLAKRNDDEENHVLYLGPTEMEDFFETSKLSNSSSKSDTSLLYNHEQNSFRSQQENSEILISSKEVEAQSHHVHFNSIEYLDASICEIEIPENQFSREENQNPWCHCIQCGVFKSFSHFQHCTTCSMVTTWLEQSREQHELKEKKTGKKRPASI